jgi:hypothetical protein
MELQHCSAIFASLDIQNQRLLYYFLAKIFPVFLSESHEFCYVTLSLTKIFHSPE